MERVAQVNIGSKFGSPVGQSVGLASLVSIFLSNAVAIAAIIFTLLLIFWGISTIMGAGQNDPQKSAQGKKAASAAIVGFIIIFVSYWIIWVIERITGLNILKPVI